MKKSSIVLFCVAALFFVSSFTLIGENLPAALFGIVLAAVLAFVGYSKYKKNKVSEGNDAPEIANPVARSRVASVAEASAPKASPAAPAREVQVYAVAGVTFKNGDGTIRQKILRTAFNEYEKEGLPYICTLSRYEYEGKPAIQVNINDQCIGNIRASDAPELLPRLDDIFYIDADIEHFTDDDEKKVYRCDVSVTFNHS